jgi:hypothetical protein
VDFLGLEPFVVVTTAGCLLPHNPIVSNYCKPSASLLSKLSKPLQEANSTNRSHYSIGFQSKSSSLFGSNMTSEVPMPKSATLFNITASMLLCLKPYVNQAEPLLKPAASLDTSLAHPRKIQGKVGGHLKFICLIPS